MQPIGMNTSVKNQYCLVFTQVYRANYTTETRTQITWPSSPYETSGEEEGINNEEY